MQTTMFRLWCFLAAATALATLVAVTEASVAYEVDTKAPGNPGMCHSKAFNLLMKIGKEYPVPNACGLMLCNKRYQIDYRFCGKVSVSGTGCELVEDLTLPYPQCCPRPKCQGIS